MYMYKGCLCGCFTWPSVQPPQRFSKLPDSTASCSDSTSYVPTRCPISVQNSPVSSLLCNPKLIDLLHLSSSTEPTETVWPGRPVVIAKSSSMRIRTSHLRKTPSYKKLGGVHMSSCSEASV